MEGTTARETALAICASYHALGDYFATMATEDSLILGAVFPPKVQPHLLPVVRGTDDQRKRRVETWAARHGVNAFWDEDSGTYRAVAMYGIVPLIAYMIPEGKRSGQDSPADAPVRELAEVAA